MGTHCHYCGATEELVREHMIPRSRRGTDDPSNIVTACRYCNNAKHDRTPDEWMAKNTPQARIARSHQRAPEGQTALQINPRWIYRVELARQAGVDPEYAYQSPEYRRWLADRHPAIMAGPR